MDLFSYLSQEPTAVLVPAGEQMKKKIKKAFTYPIVIIAVAMVISAILLIFVVPVFADMFKGFGAELPASTQFVVKLSDGLIAYWYIIGGGLFAFIMVFKWANKNITSFNHTMQKLALKIPIVGQILSKSAVANFARTLATMLAARIPMVEAMDSVAGATGHIVYVTAIMKMKDAISTGTSLTQSMRDTPPGVWPNTVIQMVQIGEESGALDEMLGKVADFYEGEVDALVDTMNGTVAWMIMVFLGVVIGSLVLAMYMPIFKGCAVI